MNAGSIHTQKKLWIVVLILFFIALNIGGYYFYKKGFFGSSADTSPSPLISPIVEKQNSVYMIPGI